MSELSNRILVRILAFITKKQEPPKEYTAYHQLANNQPSFLLTEKLKPSKEGPPNNRLSSLGRSAMLDQSREIVRRVLAGMIVPLYHYLQLGVEEQTFHRAKPQLYLVAGTHLLRLIGGKTIVEIGSMSIPMEHGIDEFDPYCCNAGHSAAVWVYSGFEVHSVDINPVCREIMSGLLESNQNLHCHTEDGVVFLKRFTQQIDLLYLDAWDVVPGLDYAERHLAAYLAAYDKLAPTCIVQIDDTDIFFGGKGELVVPRLIRDGFELLVAGRQTILIRIADL